MKTLYICILNQELKNLYVTAIENHNTRVDSQFPDAGFDLFNPIKVTASAGTKQIKIDTQIVCSMRDVHDKSYSYYLYPRSSISKTTLRLANSVGIIDSGYRGNIVGVFDVLYNESTVTNQNDRLLQICSGDLQPFYVKIIDNIQSFETTDRGTNGFGSTGI